MCLLCSKNFPWLPVSLSKRRSPYIDQQDSMLSALSPLPPTVLSLHWPWWSLCCSLYTGHSCSRIFSLAVFPALCESDSLTSKSWLSCYLLTEAPLISLYKLQPASLLPALLYHSLLYYIIYSIVCLHEKICFFWNQGSLSLFHWGNASIENTAWYIVGTQ